MKNCLYDYNKLIEKGKTSKIIVSFDNNTLVRFLGNYADFNNFTVVSSDPAFFGKDAKVGNNVHLVKNFFEIGLNDENIIYICDKHDILLDQIKYSNRKYNIEILFIDYLLQYSEEKTIHGIVAD